MANVLTVASKELSDIVRGKRFILLVAVFGLVMTAAVVTTYLSQTSGTGQPGQIGLAQGFLGAAGYSLVSMMTYFAPIMGLALGFDVISGEREKGTLKITLAQPVFRDTVINGKFLAALGAVSLATVIVSLVEVGGSTLVLGITPSSEDILRLMLFMLFVILFAMTYYGIGAFLSTATKKTSQSVIIGVVLWAAFAFIIPIIAQLVASSLVPISFRPGGNSTFSPGSGFTPDSTYITAMRNRSSIIQMISSVSPNFHFSQIAQYVLGVYSSITMGPGGGGIGPGTGQTAQTTVSIIGSLGYTWPNILVLALATTITFVASYLLFTRQEIR